MAVARRLRTGSAAVNSVITFVGMSTLPFGGVGASGMGAYTGSHGFRTFSHLKPVMRRGAMLDLDARYPPYTPRKLGLLRRLK